MSKGVCFSLWLPSPNDSYTEKKASYTEALPILYITNKFTFIAFEIIQLFRSSIPSSHWNLIRSVHVRTYNILWSHHPRTNVFRLSCEDVLSLASLREFTIRVRRSRSGLRPERAERDFEGIVGTLEVLGGLEGRGVRLVIEVEVRKEEENGNGEFQVGEVREGLDRRGMGGWIVRAVKGPE
jgi:hypothetical protein